MISSILIWLLTCKQAHSDFSQEYFNFVDAEPGTVIPSMRFKPGFLAKVVQGPKYGDPAVAFKHLEITGPRHFVKRVKTLSDFNGMVNVSSPVEALHFCRTWTDGPFFWYFEPRALEVRFVNHHEIDGFDAAVHTSTFKSLIRRFPKVSKTPSGFVVKRLLAVEDSHANVNVFESQENVGADGSYSLVLKRFKTQTSFDKIHWYLMRQE